ncbi:unannotated protein [freshwater metagenome]|uniref:Unannotated protein n=1 Tax=freshwater metagenome TaxID=449393 RepID=A0A6J7HK61_9ZZZZ|nr:hypothetical protein [Actinomycetota bacterium]
MSTLVRSPRTLELRSGAALDALRALRMAAAAAAADARPAAVGRGRPA